jgi:outer membrane immunogenic protein
LVSLLAVRCSRPTFHHRRRRPRARRRLIYRLRRPSPGSGIYLGINGGYGFGTSDWTGPGLSASNKPDGFLAGGTIGGNYQMGSFVLGVEGDFDYAPLSGSFSCPPGGTCTTSTDWLGTARVRAGWAWDRILFYGTGGGAFTDIKAATTLTNTTTEVGWTAGAGMEAALTPNWSAKIEYLYVDFGNTACGTPCGSSGDNLNLTENVIRAGINYRFGW